MKTSNKSNICRLCAVYFENGSSFFELNEDKEIYSLIHEYLPVTIPKEEKLPTKICVNCKANFQNVVKFFISVINGQKILLRKLQTQQYVQNDLILDASKDEAATIAADDEIKENLKRIVNATVCREQIGYKHFEERSKVQVSPSYVEVNDPDPTEKDFKYPKNGRKYYTKEINKGGKSQINIDPEDEHSISKIFICDICGKKFSHRSSVLYHFHSKHGENKLYNCSECNKKFSSNRLLKRHFKRIHSVIRMSECIQCHATFITENQLEDHMQTCKKNTSEYEPCKKPQKVRNKLECPKNEKAREYHCKVCDKAFKYSSNLYRHQKLHLTERPYQCTRCNRKFPTVSRLKMHENEHDKEYSYECTICQKAFVNNRILRVHYRRHTQVFPFQCDVCCKGFPDKNSTAKHMRVHTGERPFSCDVCKKTFADQSNFLRHKKAHEKNQKSTKNVRLDSVPKKTTKTSSSKAKLRMEIDYSSMTYSNDNTNNKERFIPSFDHFLAENSLKLNDWGNNLKNEKKQNVEKKDTSSKPFLMSSLQTDENVVAMQPCLINRPAKPVHQNEEKTIPLILKSTNTPNSFVIVKKENTAPVPNDSSKVIVIRSRAKNKSKLIVEKSLDTVVKKEPPELPSRKEDCSTKQNQLPELYSCEKMPPPSPTSDCIDVEDLVATFTPIISFEEIGDLNDLVNTKIDL
ncbi:zinc finger protein 239-like [Planococcus citri]|uniref:zinc finger protein 239-like n=1 Tax=Planococcus citri TaxID=170843 RepID=UPI0031F80138